MEAETTNMDPATPPSNNPLIEEFDTPFGLPPFDKIEPEHFADAFAHAFRCHLDEVDAIAGNAEAATFQNTVVALERSGALLDRVARIFFNLANAHTNPDLQAIEREIAPKLAAHESQVFLNTKLFARVDEVFDARDTLNLSQEDERLLERTHKSFVRSGANLSAQDRARVAELKGRLATLATTFSQNVLKDEQNWTLILKGESDLEGLPDGLRDAAKQAAVEAGHPNHHVITLARSSIEPFLQFSTRRELREQAYQAWINRGQNPGPTDNRPILKEIVAHRSELAGLLGYESYAGYVLDDQMAKQPDAVRALLEAVWTPARQRALEEKADLQKYVQRDGGNFEIAAWDWRHYSEKVRAQKFELNDAEVRPFFQLDKMIEAAFFVAGRLFGLQFVPVNGVPVHHPDVRAWDVKDTAGSHVGVFLGDYFARASKHSGAWMSSFRAQHKLDGHIRPIIVNTMNFARGSAGGASLLSLDDARTLFHEFGHGLHGLLSDVTYPSLSGTSVARDFVELPSQLFEHWLLQPEVLQRFARHVETDAPIPDDLIERIKSAETFNQGFQSVEYLASAFVDLALHQNGADQHDDIAAFEASVLADLGMPNEIGMRHRLSHFGHIVGGYAAGYYSYLWSEVMDADAFQAFVEAGDLFHPDTAERLKVHVYSAGGRQDPEDAYVAFRGRKPSIDGLLKKRGFMPA